MAVMFTTFAVLFSRWMCWWAPLESVWVSMVRDTEDLAYSIKVVTVEIILNIVILLLSVVLLVSTAAENPNVPVRVWVSVYALQCLIHVILLCFEYRRVARRRQLEFQGANAIYAAAAGLAPPSFAYTYDSFNMSLSFVWLNVGKHWLKSGDKLLQQNAPRLYWWVKTTYMEYDSTFILIWLAGITACCCLRCFIKTPRYRVQTVAEQEGAFEEDLNVLPKYRFHMSRETPSVGAGVIVPMDISSGVSGAERVVLHEDSECCICLCSYDDGIELHVLPCSHHFHVTCIEKWLKIKATCPVCNYNILKGSV